jgi:hypothetical protein
MCWVDLEKLFRWIDAAKASAADKAGLKERLERLDTRRQAK